ARNHHRHDWAFWAAVWDAAAAVAVCDRIGSHYNVLVAPLAAVMPSLAHCRRDELSTRELPGAVLKGGG
ncbi:hypothetical protein ACI2L5_56880, partial [Streptomyces milbemycinicus]